MSSWIVKQTAFDNRTINGHISNNVIPDKFLEEAYTVFEEKYWKIERGYVSKNKSRVEPAKMGK